jgi:hypothetical protein
MMLLPLALLASLACAVGAQQPLPKITLPWGTWQATEYDSASDVSSVWCNCLAKR